MVKLNYTREMKVLRAFVKEFSPFFKEEHVSVMTYDELVVETKRIAKEM